MVVTVKYVFGLARCADGRDTLDLELPPGATVFEAIRRLGLSALELHAAVNGESAGDGTVLRDGDEMILIPSIQGGRERAVMRRVAGALGVLLALGLGGSLVEPAAAQTRVVVPIVIPVPRAAPARVSSPSSIGMTTQTRAPQSGTTTTHVTVRDTSGAVRNLSVPPTARTLATAPLGTMSLQVTTQTRAPQSGTTTTHVTVRDTSGAARDLSVPPTARTLATVPVGTPSLLVTVDRSPGFPGTGTLDRTRVTVEDISTASHVLGGPASTSSQRMAGPGRQTLSITSDAPIDTPIVILGP